MTDSALEDFSERMQHRNLGLEVDGKTFWVVREALAEVSTVFKTMFYGEGEYKEKAQDVIQLREKNADEILELLRCLFTLKKVDDENVDVLLKFSDEYDIKNLMKNSKEFLVQQMKTAMETKVGESNEKMMKLFLTGIRYKMKDIVFGTLPTVARFGWAKLKPYFDQMQVEVQQAILFQIASQAVEHESDGAVSQYHCSCRNFAVRCKYCSILMCKNYCGWKNDYSPYKLLRCPCHGCGKPTIVDVFGKEVQSFCCQCVSPLASAELEKIGL